MSQLQNLKRSDPQVASGPATAVDQLEEQLTALENSHQSTNEGSDQQKQHSSNGEFIVPIENVHENQEPTETEQQVNRNGDGVRNGAGTTTTPHETTTTPQPKVSK